MHKVNLIYGNDTYLVKKNVNELIKLFNVELHSINTIDLDTSTISDLILELESFSLFSPNKVIIAKNFNALLPNNKVKNPQKDLDLFLNYLNNPSQSNFLIIVHYEKIDGRLKVCKRVLKDFNSVECNHLSEIEFKKHITNELTLYDKKITLEAVDELSTRVEYNLGLLELELQKLIDYLGEDELLDKSDIIKLVTTPLEIEVYSLTNHLLDKNKNLVFEIYNTLLLKRKPSELLSLITYHIILLNRVRIFKQNDVPEIKICDILKINSRRLYHLKRDAYKLNKLNTNDVISSLYDIQKRIRFESEDEYILTELFLLNL